MKIPMIGFIVLSVAVSVPPARAQNNARPTIANEEDYHRALKELSNWGRWGADDELGAANLITPAKRKQSLATAKEGVTDFSGARCGAGKGGGCSELSGADSGQRNPGRHDRPVPIHGHVSRCGTQPSGFRGLPHDGRWQGIQRRLHGRHQRRGRLPEGKHQRAERRRGDASHPVRATRLPGKATPQGGSSRERRPSGRSQALEKMEHVRGVAGRCHSSVHGPVEAARRAESLAEYRGIRRLPRRCGVFHKRNAAFPSSDAMGRMTYRLRVFLRRFAYPLHRLSLVAMGVSIFDNLDFERAVDQAKRLNRYEFLFLAAPLRIDGNGLAA